LPQHDGTALIETYDVERILADINAGDGDCSVEFVTRYPKASATSLPP
jgi:hypothetical protein